MAIQDDEVRDQFIAAALAGILANNATSVLLPDANEEALEKMVKCAIECADLALRLK